MRLRALALPLVSVTLGLAALPLPSLAAASRTVHPGARGDAPVTWTFDVHAVSALTPTDAWAVGQQAHADGSRLRPLILRWDGGRWSRVPSPAPGTRGNLSAVDALAADDAWAVGSYVESGVELTLIEHWDGTSWSLMPSPSPGLTQNDLTGVSAVAPGRAWAVGGYVSEEGHRRVRTLIVRWDGRAWSPVPSPNPGVRSNLLLGVAATSAADAWAVGSYTPTFHSGRRATLALHWDGASWSQVESPNPGGRQDRFTAVAATSSRHVWAVGSYRGDAKGHLTLAARWTGTAWKQVWSPNPGPTENHLSSVSIVSPTEVWAVGDYVPTKGTGGAPHRTLIVHFSPREWGQVPSPNPQGDDFLTTVSVDSASDGWAVGDAGALFLRWNGTRWSKAKGPGHRPA